MKLPLAAALLLGSACAARAGEAACVYERGVVVVSASVAGIAGDYILDTAAPQTALHETRAQGHGIAEARLPGAVELAGARAMLEIEVRDFDARTFAFPTPIAGVIGADVLAGRVLDLQLAPCRLALYRPGQAPAFRTRAAVSLAQAPATVSDGIDARAVRLAVSTGADRPVRLSSRIASVPGATDLAALMPEGAAKPRLRALAFQGRLLEFPVSGLLPRDDAADGVLGAPALAGWRLRFDFPHAQLLIGDEKGPPDRSGGP